MDSINNVSNNTMALKPMVPADTDPKRSELDNEPEIEDSVEFSAVDQAPETSESNESAQDSEAKAALSNRNSTQQTDVYLYNNTNQSKSVEDAGDNKVTDSSPQQNNAPILSSANSEIGTMINQLI
ncbi:MAG: hypothetical protein HOK93_05470 [Methylococcales bacterium]|jgi:hypothetical protein|nr:hypothetical protein [Methylococcales bacterium]MBT4599042.1 hypothetical protein [Methylococcales bacterium]MBT5437005.1 hypothetical protein [Methylococcales bacterium]MBT6794464.1 hypothetical protein [Methylococcales bacterium]MBT7969335.1 hypothetical protein [Methylococcales bacterium]